MRKGRHLRLTPEVHAVCNDRNKLYSAWMTAG
jgi:hypothetical protein